MTLTRKAGRSAGLALAAAYAWLLLLPVRAHAQDFEFHPPPIATDAAIPGAMRDLAERVLPIYQENDPERYLANLSVLQLVAQNYLAANQTRAQLRERRRSADAGRTPGRSTMLDFYTQAKVASENDRVAFPQAFARVYRDTVPKLNNFDAYALTTLMAASPAPMRASLQKALDQHRAKSSVSLDQAFELLTAYLNFDVQRAVAPLIAALEEEDNQKRYLEDPPILVAASHGAQLRVRVVRPKSEPARLASLFEFTNDPSVDYARECAAHGYIGVVAYVRGVGGSRGTFVPFQQDGEDARAVIAWIVQQPWSDGRVGMYGSGYSGFTAWAAAKRLPPALKAIATADPIAPGVSFPMEGGIFANKALRWAYEQTSAAGARARITLDDAAWRAAYEDWYKRGAAYRELRGPGGRNARLFARWLNHPSYDRFWQIMLPFQQEFAQVDIPVLTMSGYYAASAPGALWYFAQHTQYDSGADHRLFIGPYEDGAIRHPSVGVLNGLGIDANAQLNLRELRYQWFDSIFRNGRMPPLLQARINYEVPGANEWRHAASADAISPATLRYFLGGRAESRASDSSGSTATETDSASYLLAAQPPAKKLAASQIISFTDRRDAAWTAASDLVLRQLHAHDSVSFVSEPLVKSLDLAGFISGQLVLSVNRMDADFGLSVYELTSGGDYIKLFDPELQFRASYLKDRSHRTLLGAGMRETLEFRSERMASRRLQAGSRVVLVLSLVKRADREINYGQGDDVSVESMLDEGVEPLRIRWYSQSRIDLPVRDVPAPLTAPPKRQNSSQ